MMEDSRPVDGGPVATSQDQDPKPVHLAMGWTLGLIGGMLAALYTSVLLVQILDLRNPPVASGFLDLFPFLNVKVSLLTAGIFAVVGGVVCHIRKIPGAYSSTTLAVLLALPLGMLSYMPAMGGLIFADDIGSNPISLAITFFLLLLLLIGFYLLPRRGWAWVVVSGMSVLFITSMIDLRWESFPTHSFPAAWATLLVSIRPAITSKDTVAPSHYGISIFLITVTSTILIWMILGVWGFSFDLL